VASIVVFVKSNCADSAEVLSVSTKPLIVLESGCQEILDVVGVMSILMVLRTFAAHV
jgi:hypothetical protein